MLNESISSLLSSFVKDKEFSINDEFKCISLDSRFSDWEKDINSPSMECAALVKVQHGKDVLDGKIVIQRDNSLTDELYGVLMAKKSSSKSWQILVNIVSISS